MTAKAVVPREQAQRDVEMAIDYYAKEAGADVALDFVASLQAAIVSLASVRARGRHATRTN